MKRTLFLFFAVIIVMSVPVKASAPEGFDLNNQLDALGAGELVEQLPQQAMDMLREAEMDEISPESLLSLSPGRFFSMLWQIIVQNVRQPLVVLGTVMGIIVLTSLLEGMKNTAGENSLSPVFGAVSILAVLTSLAFPIMNAIIDTASAVRQASMFMLSFIPMFSATLVASGRPVTGATYNLFLFGTCQIVAQVDAQTLVPLMGIFLALCIVGALVPELNIASTAGAIKSIVSWALGLSCTVFVGLLSVQTMVAGSSDSLTARTAKFLIGSFVPVVGSALGDAYMAAQGSLRLIKTTVGAYGIIVAAMIFLPILIQTFAWFMLTNVAAIGSDILGVTRISGVLRACGSVLGILLAVIICYALLIIVSTTVILITGMGGL